MLYFRLECTRESCKSRSWWGQRKAAPLDWLDSFCMRNFTGSAEFDDTLPIGEGRLEAGLDVDPARLVSAMSDWATRRGKGNGHPVTVEISEAEYLCLQCDPTILVPTVSLEIRICGL